MKLALIPPLGLEYYMHRTTCQMALAIDVCMLNTNRTLQLKNAHQHFDHIILDNGANEGTTATPQVMKRYGTLIHATEIVLPDSLDNTVKTIQMVKGFVNREESVWKSFHDRMAVVQGTTEAALLRCVDAFAQLEPITTVGIPRRVIDRLLRTSARVDLANKIDELYPNRFRIHALGAHPMWPKEVRYLSKYTKVRSMDTSLPFNWAMVGRKVDDATPGGVSRSPKYFTKVAEPNLQVVDYNISKLVEWASGK